jgi:hypothetical protein
VTVEAVDLKDLIAFSERFELHSPNALEELVTFAQNVMTNVEAPDLLRRVASIQRGTARKGASDAEQAALCSVSDPSHNQGVDLLAEIGKQPGVRTHRPALLRAPLKALNACDGKNTSLNEAAIRICEENRLTGRPLPRRAVGSTLLLKGLEGDAPSFLMATNWIEPTCI